MGRWRRRQDLAATFFFLIAMWLGIAQPRGTNLAVSPLFAVAYWAPMAFVPHAPGPTLLCCRCLC